MRDPHGDDTSGGFEKGVSNATDRQEGGLESALHTDHDAAEREADVKRTNAWIKGGEKTD